MTLTCNNCLVSKDVSEFHKRNDTISGYRKECKVCRNTKAKDSYDSKGGK